MSKTTNTPAAETLTGIALAIAVMGKAMTALSRANGTVWRSLQEAAGGFPATMSDADKSALSSQLSKAYRTKGGLDNAPQLASMHARAIFLIATGKAGTDGTVPNPAKFSNMSAFFGAFSEKKTTPTAGTGGTVAPTNPNSATAHRADAGNAPSTGAPVANGEASAIGMLVTQNMLSAHGLPADVVQVFQDLLTLARANPQIQDGLTMVRNVPQRLLDAVPAWVAAERASMTAAMGNTGAAPQTAMAQALTDAVAKTSRKGGKLEKLAA